MVQQVLTVQSLSKKYGKTQALDDVSLTAYQGEVIAVLGQNGAGKTSLINCILGLQSCTFKKLRIFDEQVAGQHRRVHLRSRIGVMMQMGNLTANLTVAEQLDLFCSYYSAGYPAEELIEFMQLSGIARKRFGKLSGGQRQQVLFALALAGKPDLLFLDEPSAGMDLEARHGLWQNVQRLRQQGCSIFLTTHYIEEAERLADRVVVIRNGCITADAPLAQMLVGYSSLEQVYLDLVSEHAHG